MLDSTIIEFDIINFSYKQITIDELSMNTKKIYWIHCNLNQSEFIKKSIKKLSLPEDVTNLFLKEDKLPKVIDSDEALTLQIPSLSSTEFSKKKGIVFNNLIIHLTSQFCLTAAHETIPSLMEFANVFKKNIHYAKTPCFISFLILDITINEYAKLLLNFELATEPLDLGVHGKHKNIYHEVMNYKKQLLKIKRYTIAIREILLRISGKKISVISADCRSSLSNLSNHSHMLVHEIDSIRDMLNGLLSQIDNALMQKMSETMKVLTAFASIFLPLTLITGIYGMNFHWMPELNWKYGYFYGLGLIAGCAAVLLFIFKQKKWF